jgi:death on curing protein
VSGVEPIWINEGEVLTLHDWLLALHGGAPGVRDEGLLKSALARPRQLAAYGEGSDLIDLASAYTAGIVNNHPFVDGNKRTGFVVGILFLEINSFRFIATETDAANAVIALAQGNANEARYTNFLRENVTPQ